MRGGADESYGIEVAKLAGVPDAVVESAKKFLAELNEWSPGVTTHAPPREEVGDGFSQVSFSQGRADQVKEELNTLQIDTLTPIEALNKLYELKKLASE